MQDAPRGVPAGRGASANCALGTVWRGGRKRAAMRVQVQACGHPAAQVPHPFPGPLPQPYPCAEDEECGADEYCASPARGGGGAGPQVCLACRKRRKRCMRHAMCCPGNYCKNGECPRCAPCASAHLRPGGHSLCSEQAAELLADGYSAGKGPLNPLPCQGWSQRAGRYRGLGALYFPPGPPQGSDTTAYLGVEPLPGNWSGAASLSKEKEAGEGGWVIRGDPGKHACCLPGLFLSLTVPPGLYPSGFSFMIPVETVVSHKTPISLCWSFLRELLLSSTLASLPYPLPPLPATLK